MGFRNKAQGCEERATLGKLLPIYPVNSEAVVPLAQYFLLESPSAVCIGLLFSAEAPIFPTSREQ